MPLEASGALDLETIALATAGEYVRIRRTLGVADRKEVADRIAARCRFLALPLEATDPLVIKEAAYATLSVAIQEWSWSDPITFHSVKRLDDESQEVIFARMAELYPPDRTDDERKNSSGDGALLSSDVAPSLVNSGGAS